jgi:predicted AlkP superfamily pyrophosphatase or phosphodiesterase
MNAALAMPGVAAIYRGEDLAAQRKSLSQIQDACELSYMPGRSGDLIVLQKPYWLTGTYNDASKPHTGTSHGTPYYYDQRVPILLMGYGIQPGEYFGAVTPADIAPTFAALTNITLSTHNGRALSEALLKVRAK